MKRCPVALTDLCILCSFLLRVSRMYLRRSVYRNFPCCFPIPYRLKTKSLSIFYDCICLFLAIRRGSQFRQLARFSTISTSANFKYYRELHKLARISTISANFINCSPALTRVSIIPSSSAWRRVVADSPKV